MDFKKYTPSNSSSKRYGKTTVRFGTEGSIYFSKNAVKILELKPGDKIHFLQDKIRQSDWYIEKTLDKDSFVLRYSGDQLGVNSSFLAKKLLESVGLQRSTTFKLATEPTEGKYYAILTRLPNGK